MQISAVMEKMKPEIAAENMANRLADRVRNIWLEKIDAGYTQWEENFFEDSEGVHFLERESFPDLVGIDYIFRWWGSRDADGLAGELTVLWKSEVNGTMTIFKTWVRFSEMDFTLGIVRDETRKREAFRSEFREAYAQWQKLYLEEIKKLN